MVVNKKRNAQVTIWIILAIVIVGVIILLFLLKIPQKYFFPSEPNVQLQDCVKEELSSAIKEVSKRGGSINPVNAITYKGEKVEYLCYTNQYYQTCVNQQPLLKQHVEREIFERIKGKVRSCLDNLKENLKAKGYEVSGKGDISIAIVPNYVKLTISELNIRKENSKERYDKFVVEERSEIYDLIMLASSILNWEARYGDSDITTYMMYYPNIKVEKYKQSDGSKIYILSARNTKEEFVFATRSLSWPAGYGLGLTHKPT